MRIRTLKLVRYGRFTDCALDFAAPGLHLVVGPNEAGKSTLRSSVGELLYGIHPQTKLDFVHPMQDLRIDAELQGADGERLDVVRLKRNKDPLRTTGDEPLQQGTLDRLLAGVDKEAFRLVFALDHAELRDGGRALLEGKGDLGEALFESRSSARLTRVQEQLREQYKALYTVRGKNQPLNALLGPSGRVAQAKRERDASLLDPREYRRITDAAGRARGELQALTDALRTDQIELNRLRRIRQAYGTVDERARLLAGRAALLAQGTAAPANAQDSYTELDRDRRALAEGERNALADLEKLDALLAEVAQRAEAVGALTSEGASTGVPTRPSTGPEYVARLETLLTGVEELRDAGRDAEIRLDEAHKTVLKRTQELDKREAAFAELTEPTDSSALRAGLKAIPEGLGVRIDGLRRQSETAEAKLKRAWKRHGRFALPESLGELAVPGEHELAAQLKRIAEADALTAAAEREHGAEVARGREQQRELESFLAQDPPPSEEDLERIRARRQELWSGLRASLADGRPAASPELVPEYEAAVSAGDDTADWMRREAQRLAERRRLELAVREAADRAVELDDALGAARSTREALDAEWQRLWAPSALPTPTPDSAEDLMRALTELRELSEAVEQHRRELEADEVSARTHAARLRELLAASAFGAVEAFGVAEGLSLAELRALAEERQSQLADAARKHATAAAKIGDVRIEVAEAKRDEAEVKAFVEGWRRAWNELTSGNGLEGSPDAVKGAVERMLRVEEDRARLHAQREELRSGLRKTREQQERTRTEFAALLAECGAESEDELRAAIARGAELRSLDGKLDVLRTSLADHGASIEQLEREVAEHDVDELEARIAEWERRVEDLDRDRGEKNAELAGWEQDVRRMDGSAAAAEKAEAVEHELAAVIGHGQEYLRLYLAERLLLENIEAYRQQHQGPVLSRAQEVFRALTAGRFTQLVDDTGADGKAVLRARRAAAEAIAAAAAPAAIAAIDGAALTDPSPAGPPVEPADPPVEGALVDVEAMSEGTRDQLYLALRLATLERYAEEGRPMPLLLDDVLMTFDDGRAAAALRVFDELADRFQVILLTHHAHLTEVAARALPAGRVHVHRVG